MQLSLEHHTIRKVLQSATRSLNGGDCLWFKRSTREKRLVIGDNVIIIIIINVIFYGREHGLSQ